MASEDECMTEIFVEILWQGRELAVPLSQLEAIDVDEETQEAIEDWHYWVARGYQYGLKVKEGSRNLSISKMRAVTGSASCFFNGDQNDSADNSSSTAINQPLFRAVGIIRGEVKFNDDEKNPLTVTISKFEYRLFYNKRNPNALTGLKQFGQSK